MTILGRCAASGVFLFAALFALVGDAAPACAAGTPRAVLVVDTGESEHRFCVSLPADEVSGIELIELAADQHGLSYKLGYGGGAVCMLAGVGPTGDDCFEDHPNFWGYWRGDGGGGWVWSGSGAGSTRVGNGDVEGWSWGSGSNGDTHQRPPATTFGDVCAEEERPVATKKPRAGHNDDAAAPAGPGQAPPRMKGSRPAVAPPVAGREGRDAPPTPTKEWLRSRRDARRDKSRPGPRDYAATADGQTLAPARSDEAPGALQDPQPSGPPSAGIAALGAAALLGGAGVVLARRRRSGS